MSDEETVWQTKAKSLKVRVCNDVAHPGLLCPVVSGRVNPMFRDAATYELDDPQPTVWEQMLADLPNSAEEWSRGVNRLNRWEDEHLLGTDHPAAELLLKHRKKVERMMFWGQVFALVAAHPEYCDSETAGMIMATQRTLWDKLRMFHQPMPKEEAERILREAFPEP
jgi:hypothetical protein